MTRYCDCVGSTVWARLDQFWRSAPPDSTETSGAPLGQSSPRHGPLWAGRGLGSAASGRFEHFGQCTWHRFGRLWARFGDGRDHSEDYSGGYGRSRDGGTDSGEDCGRDDGDDVAHGGLALRLTLAVETFRAAILRAMALRPV